FYNRARDRQVKFMMSAMAPPGDLSIRLPDLRSRLQAGVVYQLHELSDSEKALLLERRAGQLGIRLPETVINYVLQRHDRSAAALMEFMRELDRQSLEKKRRVTIPLVREIMGW
ncbi:MAG: DnaA/Hda family protein, partial [Oceanisphaera sp.]|nr:DnaA/Hda family protein [Oceanisphaera sp.]